MRALLWPFAILFYCLASLRVRLYQWGLLSSKKVDQPVLCVGNISTGGTGKTPWVHLLTQYFLDKNKNVTLLSRGYSGDYDGVLKVEETMDPRRCGDEPLWLKLNTNASIYVGRNRYKAAVEAIKNEKTDLFILDDAFQHLKLQRDFNIVLLDASVPRWHYQPLPVGHLREGFSALKRAQIVIVNKCNYASRENLDWVKEQCLKYVDEKNIFYSDFVFSNWEPLISELNWSEPKKPLAMTCGVGNPGAFLKTLEELGVKPGQKFIFPDHYYWKPSDIERMAYNMKREGSQDLMMTEKDAVKLNRYTKHFMELGIQLWVCKMKVQVRENESQLWAKLDEVFA